MELDFQELYDVVGGEEYEPDQNIIERFRTDDCLDVPIELTDAELWANYVNDDLYHMDKKIREFLKKIRWRQSKGGYRTTAAQVFIWIFGRKATPSDGHVFRYIHLLLRYYCSSYTGITSFQGKRVNRVYKFTKYASVKKRPYSIRLRMEEIENESKNYTVWRKGTDQSRDKREHRRSKDKPASS